MFPCKPGNFTGCLPIGLGIEAALAGDERSLAAMRSSSLRRSRISGKPAEGQPGRTWQGRSQAAAAPARKQHGNRSRAAPHQTGEVIEGRLEVADHAVVSAFLAA